MPLADPSVYEGDSPEAEAFTEEGEGSTEAAAVYLTYPTDGNFSVMGSDLNNFWCAACMEDPVHVLACASLAGVLKSSTNPLKEGCGISAHP